MNRRDFLQKMGAVSTVAMGMAILPNSKGYARGGTNMKLPEFENWQLNEAQWREKLTQEQYYILRGHGTERPFSSPLDAEKRAGIFHCAACDLPVFDMAHKFDSGTGWPSFYQPAHEAHVGTSTDFKLIYPRTEFHCARCGGHFGHVFKDGPKPTGLRYCANGLAFRFAPAA